jgi:hypothetical protein
VLQQLVRFAGLETLDVVIGMPECERKFMEGARFRCGEIHLERVDPTQKLPESFMPSSRCAFFCDKADRDMCYSELERDITDLFISAKDEHCDTEGWQTASWKVPGVAFKMMRRDAVDEKELVPRDVSWPSYLSIID